MPLCSLRILLISLVMEPFRQEIQQLGERLSLKGARNDTIFQALGTERSEPPLYQMHSEAF